MRQIGNNTWYKPGVDFDKDETVFEFAKYLGADEGNFGVFQVFQNLENGECFNLGGGHLNWLCDQIQEGDVIKLDYQGEEKLKQGKFKGKNSHRYALWIREEDEYEHLVKSPKSSQRPPKNDPMAEVEDLDDEVVEEVVEPRTRKKAAKKKAGRVSKKKTVSRKVEPVEDDEDDLDDLE